MQKILCGFQKLVWTRSIFELLNTATHKETELDLCKSFSLNCALCSLFVAYNITRNSWYKVFTQLISSWLLLYYDFGSLFVCKNYLKLENAHIDDEEMNFDAFFCEHFILFSLYFNILLHHIMGLASC